MARMIFVNLPVTDVGRATAFYEAIGATRNEKFSDAKASCMVFSDSIHVMLLHRDFFATFTPKPIADEQEVTAVLIALSFDSREEVDAVMEKVLAAGGREPRPVTDLGFMYQRSFEDPDGHMWEPFWMNPGATEQEIHAGEPQPA